jgi:ParB family transcriptional regulator, chromosome partitioning protein
VAERRGMGRGLAAILSVAPSDELEPELRELSVELIEPNPRQPRERFDEQALAGLADSVKERGVLQPVIVRPRPGGRYELVAGERRWRAAQLAGLETLPAILRPDDDAASLELALIENMAREDLNPLEEARACAALVEEMGLTREEVGRRVGRSRVAVSNLLRLLDLPDEALALVAEGRLSEGHGRALLLCPDHRERRGLAHEAADGGWSVRELEDRARQAAGRAAPRRRRRRGADPDEAAATTAAADALAATLGADVAVTRRGGRYRAEITLDSLEEAHVLARRLSSGRRLD